MQRSTQRGCPISRSLVPISVVATTVSTSRWCGGDEQVATAGVFRRPRAASRVGRDSRGRSALRAAARALGQPALREARRRKTRLTR